MNFSSPKARSKLPKKRRRVLPVEQPRRQRRGNEHAGPHRQRMNPHPKPHPANAIFKDAFGSAKIGKISNFLLLERILCESFYLKSFHLSFQDAKLSKCFYSSMKHLYCSNVCFENFLRSRQRRKCHRPFAPTARRSTDSCTGSETALNKSDISWFLQPSSAFAAPATDHWKLWFSAPFAAWVVAG